MNSSNINWRRFTLQLSSAVIQKIEPLTIERRRNVLLIDDSLFSRARAKKVELLAKVYDHVEHKYTKGFRIIQTYGNRWNIEFFFKMCKSYLKLGKESRTMSYDAMTTHVSIVLVRYMLLSLEQRRKIDKRSIGELFYVSCDELQDLQYMDALIMILKKLVSMITEKWLFLEKELNAMLDSLLENLPKLWHRCLERCA